MLLYWFMFLLPALGLSQQVRTNSQRNAWLLVVVFFALIIGLRFEVGGDWSTYLRHFNSISRFTFAEVLLREDPGYYLINWLVERLGGSIYWVNTACGIITMAGISTFARNQPLPWLALLVAIPYLIIVVSMGYSRQATALAFSLIGLAALAKDDTRRFVFWIIVGALFHKSAVLLIPVGALSATQNQTWTYIWVGIMAVGAAYFLVVDAADALWMNYVEADYAAASEGGQIRVFMNAVPSVLVLLFRDRLFYNESERKLWLWMAIFSLVTVPLVSFSATAVDRVALYFIPIQMFAFSRIPLIMKDKSTFNLAILAVVCYYALVQFVWLNFATHASFWVPYKSAAWSDSTKRTYGEPKLFDLDNLPFNGDFGRSR